MTVRVFFLAVEIDAKDPKNPVDPTSLPPESEWLFLVKAPDSRSARPAAQRLGNLWDQYKKNQALNLSPLARRRRLAPRQGGNGVRAENVSANCMTANAVEKGQLLAIAGQDRAGWNDVASKIGKLETAEYGLYRAAAKTKEEAARRAGESREAV